RRRPQTAPAPHGWPMTFEKFKEDWQRQLLLDREMTAGWLRVGLAISFRLNRESFDAWPGLNTIAKDAGVHRSTVKPAIAYLEKKHLRVRRDKVRGKNTPNHYEPLMHDARPPFVRRLFNDQQKMNPGRSTAMNPGWIQSYSPRTSNLTSDRTSTLRRRFSIGADQQEVGEKEVLRAARSQYGERGASLAARALKAGMSASDVMYELRESIGTVDDLAYALGRPPGLN